jgi:group I intron endonuclease
MNTPPKPLFHGEIVYIIYLITNTVNGKFYVGQTKQKLHRRWSKHISDANCGKGYYFSNAILKYGCEAFKVEQIDTAVDLAKANELEKHYITVYESSNPEKGYNSTYGGEGVPVTPEGLEKIRQAMTGMPRSEAAKEKLRVQRLGDKNPMFGKPVSEETRQKRSAKLKGRPRPKEVMQRIVETRMLNKFIKSVAWG